MAVRHILKVDHPKTIPIQFGLNWKTGFCAEGNKAI
jgi:hypothetical protein